MRQVNYLKLVEIHSPEEEVPVQLNLPEALPRKMDGRRLTRTFSQIVSDKNRGRVIELAERWPDPIWDY